MKMKMGVIKVIYGALQSHFEEAPSGVTRQLYGAVRHCRDSLHCHPLRPAHHTATSATDFRSARAKNTVPAYISRIYIYTFYNIHTALALAVLTHTHTHTRGHRILFI